MTAHVDTDYANPPAAPSGSITGRGRSRPLKGAPPPRTYADMDAWQTAVETRLGELRGDVRGVLNFVAAGAVALLVGLITSYLILSSRIDEGNNRIVSKLDAISAQVADVKTDIAVLKVAKPERLIRFHDLTSAAQRGREDAVLLGHGLANAMGQEPRRLHGAFQHPLNLAGADPLLARAHQVDDLQPQMQRQMRGLEDSPLADRELPFAGVALVKADPRRLAAQAANASRFLAMRADGTIGPKARFDIRERGGFGLELRGVED